MYSKKEPHCKVLLFNIYSEINKGLKRRNINSSIIFLFKNSSDVLYDATQNKKSLFIRAF